MKSNRGFTLIEILVVLGILAAVLSIGLPRIGKREDSLKSVAHQISVLTRQIRNNARLFNSTYRLVIHMNDQEASFWVERAAGVHLVDPEAYDPENKPDKDDKDKKQSEFQIDKSLLKKPRNLPKPFVFGSVETINMKQPITEGDAYVHFFPEGLVETAAIQITNRKNITWTLVFDPLTGQADIIEAAKGLKEISR